MGERNWKLGDDCYEQDNILDGITFEELILTVHCNCQKVTPKAVKEQVELILGDRLQDLNFLVENNMDEIIKRALSGRGE